MRFDTPLEVIAATPSYLFACFCLLVLLLHIVFVWFGRLSDLNWKRVDYIWLGAAALGLLAQSAAADRFLSERYAPNMKAQAESAYRFLRSDLELGGGPGSPLGTPRVRTSGSPPDFDAIETARHNLYGQFQALVAHMPGTVSAPYPSLKDLGFILPADNSSYFTYYVSDLRAMAEQYEKAAAKANQLETSSKLSTLDEIFCVLGPLILAFALALRITKVSGELANAKRKAQS